MSNFQFSCINCGSHIQRQSNNLDAGMEISCWSCNTMNKIPDLLEAYTEQIPETTANEKIINFLSTLQVSSPNVMHPNIADAVQRLNQIFNHFTFLQTIPSIQGAYNRLIDHNPFTSEVDFYGLGVDIYHKGISLNDISYFDAAIPVFAICEGLNISYHQAYNRIGDCLIRKNRFDRALNFFRTSLYYIENGQNIGYIDPNTYKGDNYFKISLCLHKMSINHDMKSVFLLEAESLCDDGYANELNIWGYKNWDDVKNKFEITDNDDNSWNDII